MLCILAAAIIYASKSASACFLPENLNVRWPRKIGEEMETGCMAAINTPNRTAGIGRRIPKSPQANAGGRTLFARNTQADVVPSRTLFLS